MADDVKAFVFCFWLGLLFCKLLWSGFGELVSMMCQDPNRSIDNLYEKCESQFLETIGVELSKEWKDLDNKKLYEAGWGGGRGKIFLLGMREAKFKFC